MDSLITIKRDQFREEGFLRVSGLLDIIDIEIIRDNLILKVNEALNINLKHFRANDYDFSHTRRLPGMNPIMRKIKEEGVLSSIEKQLKQEVDKLFGRDHWVAHDLWYSLLSVPGLSNDWNIPKKTWHADEPVIVNESLPLSIFTFVFLDNVESRSGATTVITGTHRQGERIAEVKGAPHASLLSAYDPQIKNISKNLENINILEPQDLLNTLKDESEWFRDLSKDDGPNERIAKFMKEGTSIEGMKHRVIELTGKPGDIIFLDPRCLHSGSSISSQKPRQVIRLDFRRVL